MKRFIGCFLVCFLFFLGGCASLSDNVVTTGIDEAGNAVKTVASSNTTKTTSLYKAHADIAKQQATANKDAGLVVDIYGLDRTVNEKGEEVLFAKVKITNRPVVNIVNKLPERIPDHWGKEVLISAFKYGTIAFGIDTAGNVVSGLLAGAAGGIAVEGSNNVIQGNQNKARDGQDIRSDYVTCADGECGDNDLATCEANPPGGFSDSGTPMYNETLSCGSYFTE